ncbi:outer membrane lipoprotein carrier protein LolA [Brumimicrobium glaciale]|uniref:Outer membrane lipoprotein carrier protein LolA n=1 Tax=Brumimicrobium glaciale TaxID=200475 RepID=A0A4Q4KJK0_9FLAO|nr:outer membrane lipoprotein carrier protein LolA [Brumimicrobium glaciale]RYM33020.1 outer membrane lipoprotein carrier protein LolA [Brumimicrobium glaciale]
MKHLLIAVLFITSSIFAQSDQKSEQILSEMSSEIKKMNSFYIEFTMNVKNPATGEDSNQKGIGYVKGNKYYASLGQNTLVSNAVKNWTIVKEEKVTYQSDVDLDNDESMNPKKLMTIWEEGFKNKYDQETTMNGKKVHQISLYPLKPSEVNYHTIVLYVEASNNQLLKAIMKTKDGSTMTYSIDVFEKNKSVPDSKFVYNPQNFPGYQLIRD